MEEGADTIDVFLPLPGAGNELLFSGGGEFVPFAAAAGGVVPLATDEFVGFESVEEGVESTGGDVDAGAALLLEELLNAVAVFGSVGEDGEDEDVETSPEPVG